MEKFRQENSSGKMGKIFLLQKRIFDLVPFRGFVHFMSACNGNPQSNKDSIALLGHNEKVLALLECAKKQVWLKMLKIA